MSAERNAVLGPAACIAVPAASKCRVVGTQHLLAAGTATAPHQSPPLTHSSPRASQPLAAGGAHGRDVVLAASKRRVCATHRLHPPRRTAHRAQIKGYPSLKAVHMGEDYKPYKGARSLEALKSFIEEAAVELKTEA